MKVNKRTITRDLLENFIQEVLALLNIAISPYERPFLRFPYHICLITLYDSSSTGLALNVSVVSVWIHVCYIFNNSLRSLRLCVKFFFTPLDSSYISGGYRIPSVTYPTG